MLFHLFGTTLEQHWGAFRYNVFLLIGYARQRGGRVRRVGRSSARRAPTCRRDGRAAGVDRRRRTGSSTAACSWRSRGCIPTSSSTCSSSCRSASSGSRCCMWIVYGYCAWPRRLDDADARRSPPCSTTCCSSAASTVRELRQGHRRRSFQAKAKKATAAPRHAVPRVRAQQRRLAARRCSATARSARARRATARSTFAITST